MIAQVKEYTRSIFERKKWFLLLHSLLLLLFLYPYLETLGELHRPWSMTALNSVVVLAILYVVEKGRHQHFTGLILGAFALIATWIPNSILAGDTIQIIESFSLVCLYAFTIIITLPYLLYKDQVREEDLYSAVCLYILLGLLWASLYQIVELIFPGSFYLNRSNNIDLILNWSDFLFYSFITLTSTGYGDITPITSQARSLALLQAVTGVIFMAVMVGRMVGLCVSHSLLEKSEGVKKKD